MNIRLLGPDDTLPVDYTPGAHTGWDDYRFVCQGHRWRLLVIRDTSDPSSQIIRENDRDDEPAIRQFWPEYHVISLPCVITPEAAYKIITANIVAWQDGIAAGRKQKTVEIRKALDE